MKSADELWAEIVLSEPAGDGDGMSWPKEVVAKLDLWRKEAEANVANKALEAFRFVVIECQRGDLSHGTMVALIGDALLRVQGRIIDEAIPEGTAGEEKTLGEALFEMFESRAGSRDHREDGGGR
jgi:hypothetical protein